MKLEQERELLTEYGRRMSRAGLSVGTSGNLSIYVPEAGLMAITPSGLDYEATTPADIVVMDLDAHVVEGERKPSSEWALHTAFYRQYPAARAVVHTHSMYCTVLACLGKPLEAVHYAIAAAGAARVPVAPHRLFGTPEMAEAAVERERRCCWATTVWWSGRAACRKLLRWRGIWNSRRSFSGGPWRWELPTS